MSVTDVPLGSKFLHVSNPSHLLERTKQLIYALELQNERTQKGKISQIRKWTLLLYDFI